METPWRATAKRADCQKMCATVRWEENDTRWRWIYTKEWRSQKCYICKSKNVGKIFKTHKNKEMSADENPNTSEDGR